MLVVTEIKQIFHMKEGTDESSYVKTSYIQEQVLSLTKSIKENALREFCYKEQPTTMCIADLGCSSAEQNTLNLTCDLINTIEKTSQELRINGPQEYQVYLNDLLGNDFNTIFRSLENFGNKLKQKKGDGCWNCFVNGVPGSFYGRLFPSNNIHFIHSSYSLHWLSQKGIEDNKRNIYIGRTSPPNVLKAYYDQYENDILTFLRCRSKEVVEGGTMVITMVGRNVTELYSKESCYMFEYLAIVLNDMVCEGLLGEEKLNTFNFPFYAPSKTELIMWVEKEESFTINQVEVSEVNWKTTIKSENSYKSFDHNDFAKCLRAFMEPFVVNHFGEAISNEAFRRYTGICKASMAKEKKNVFINVTVWLARKAQSTSAFIY